MALLVLFLLLNTQIQSIYSIRLTRQSPPENQCSPNEVFTDCVDSCRATCDDPNRIPCPQYEHCGSGCICKNGYFLDNNWLCVPYDKCESYKCSQRPEEHWNRCGGPCQVTCTNYQNPPPYCRSKKCTAACYCNYGFVRDISKNGTCIKPEECSKKCPSNEVLSESGPLCVRTATNPRPQCINDAPPKEPICICESGFTRNAITNRCEPTVKSYNKKRVYECPTNETFSFCGTRCNENCHNYHQREKCDTFCQKGCFCMTGYVRAWVNGVQKCIDYNDCPYQYQRRPKTVGTKN